MSCNAYANTLMLPKTIIICAGFCHYSILHAFILPTLPQASMTKPLFCVDILGQTYLYIANL